MTETQYDVDENGEVIEPPQDEPVDDDPDQDEGAEPDAGQSVDAQRGEFDELYAALEAKSTNYQKAVVKMVNEVQTSEKEVPLEVCEMCNDAFSGFRWSQPQDELHAQMFAAAGVVMSLEALEPDPDAEECPTCKRKGIVKLPSDVPGNKARTCRRCHGAGYLDRHPESGSLIAAATEPPNGQTEAYAGVPTDDPAVADLRNRGFTIIPPMATITTTD